MASRSPGLYNRDPTVQIANGKFTLKSRMLHLIVAISDGSSNGRNAMCAAVSLMGRDLLWALLSGGPNKNNSSLSHGTFAEHPLTFEVAEK